MQVGLRISEAEAQAAAEGLARRCDQLGGVMTTVAVRLTGSVVRNFEVGGRYGSAGDLMGGTNRWKPVRGNSTPLVRSGMLRDSIRPRSTEDTAMVVTGLEYAAIHNNGGQIRSYARSELFSRNRAGKGSNPNHKNLNPYAPGTTAGKGNTYGESVRTMPARPFLVIQPADVDDAKSLIRGHLLGGG